MENIKLLLKKYIKWKTKFIAPKTLKVHIYWTTYFITWIKEKEINKDNLLEFTQHLNDKQNKKIHTINKARMVIRNFIKFIDQKERLNFEYTDIIKALRLPQKLSESVFLPKDVWNILNQIDTTQYMGLRNYTILFFAYTTGARAMEIERLNLQDIDLKQRTIILIGKGKNQRVIPMRIELKKILKEYLENSYTKLKKEKETKAVFLNRNGTRITYRAMKNIIDQFADQFKFPIGMHTFRRTFATELVKAGASIYAIKDMLGHNNLSNMKYYIQLDINTLAQAVNKLNRPIK
ncbi:MAG: site-specific integrase [Lentisphaeria bacterium]|nr:site-specific integrase [Lentisphaeria bacterium]